MFCTAFRYTYTEDSIEWADVIFPTGGDGTFLLAASKIHDNKKPVIGFNSDPHRSEGHLCLPKHYSNYIKEAIERLQNVLTCVKHLTVAVLQLFFSRGNLIGCCAAEFVLHW